MSYSTIYYFPERSHETLSERAERIFGANCLTGDETLNELKGRMQVLEMIEQVNRIKRSKRTQ
jgi:hypothetical protein